MKAYRILNRSTDITYCPDCGENHDLFTWPNPDDIYDTEKPMQCVNCKRVFERGTMEECPNTEGDYDVEIEEEGVDDNTTD